jgi:uncharacterized cupredoxin-like copper-binding protein
VKNNAMDIARDLARLGIGARFVALLVAHVVALGVTAVTLAGRGDPPLATSIEIDIHFSRFEPASINVPVGVPVTFTIRNLDPIDHEWIVGTDAVQAKHRTGTELLHPEVPTEVFIRAGETQVTTVTFEATGSLSFICHLPAHEAYGMVGLVTIR